MRVTVSFLGTIAFQIYIVSNTCHPAPLSNNGKQCSSDYIIRNVIKVSVNFFDNFWKLNTTFSCFSVPTFSVFLKEASSRKSN